MFTRYADAQASIMIKYIQGADHLVIHVFKRGWRFPDRTSDIPDHAWLRQGRLRLDHRDRAQSTSSAGPMVEFYIKTETTGNFLAEFGKAEWMWIRFDEGSEKPWPARMYGSRNAAAMFARCVVAMAESSSTQPYGKPAPTQPYSNSQTQPYAEPNRKDGPTPTQQPAKKDNGSI